MTSPNTTAALQALVDTEMETALSRYGDLKSRYEAYAVLLEECQELDEESGEIIQHLDAFWDGIRDRSPETTLEECVIQLQDGAIKTIEHAIQVAAVATLAMKVLSID